MNRLPLIVSACTLAITHCASAASQPFGEQGKWPVPDGGKVTLEVDPKEVFVGENILVHFVLENTGTEPFNFSQGSDYRGVGRHLRFEVTLLDQAGRAIEADPPGQSFGGFGGEGILQPGAKWTQSLPIMRYCRLEAAGRYTVRVRHDLGWKRGDRKHPVGETEIVVKMPDELEAEKVVAEMERLPDGPNNSMGQRASPYADWECLRAPIYLKPLVRRLEEGNLRALKGLARMETLEATRALIEMASRTPVKIAAEIAAHLPSRMPLSRDQEERVGQWEFEYLIPRKRMAERGWKSELRGDARALARSLMPRDPALVAPAARLLVHVGNPEDSDVISAALKQLLEGDIRPRRSVEDNLEWPEPLAALSAAANALREKGWVLPETLNGNSEILLYFWQLSDSRIPRTRRSAEILDAYFVTSHWQMREAAVHAIPEKIDERSAAKLSTALDDQDYGVVRAACRRAGRSGRKEFAQRLLNIVLAENNRALVVAASEAADALGASGQLLDAWADRLVDSTLWRDALDFLQNHTIAWKQGYGGRTDLSREERVELRMHWRAFLEKHRDSVAAGKLFELGDPAVVAGMFGRARQFTFPDGAQWPASPADQ
jgi:hypothetical protein